MLVLFMLIGTAFLMSSSQEAKTAKASAKGDRLGNYATKLLDRALLQVLRDSDNVYSVIRYHSLLRDLYGTDGFQGVATTHANGDPVDLLTTGQTPRFAGGTAAAPLGPTQGQFIDIYFKKLNLGVDDPQTVEREEKLTLVDLRHVLKLDRNVYGRQQIHALPLTKGYYNGCLLTITSGPAAGQSTRIVDYEFQGDIPNPSPTVAAQLFRFRVMTFQRADGQPLRVGTSDTPPQRLPEIVDLAGATFLVNGRAFSGTGVGYNPLASSGQARLTALELLPIPFDVKTNPKPTTYIGAELALLPNSVYFDPRSNWIRIGAASTPNPFPLPIPNPTVQVQFLNDPSPRTPFFNYHSFAGPGDADESYDAADFQNMFLALLTVTPRSQGRVVTANGTYSIEEFLDPNSPNTGAFLRLDLEDLPLPSFHRPDLVNFWYHRLLALLTAPPNNITPNEAVRAILQPYQVDGTPTPPITAPQAALITAIKRQIMLRPIREDHPRFDGGNPQSVTDVSILTANNLVTPSGNQIAIPYWPVVGPWDVDNDNDGVPESVWVDLGDPVQEAEDGTRYKALYAFLIIDLDSRLNVNAHGLADHIRPTINGIQQPDFDPANNSLAGVYSSDSLAHGLGYGPAEITMRPVFPVPWNAAGIPVEGNRSEAAGPVDSYAAELIGRLKLDATAVPGKWGFIVNQTDAERATPGFNYKYSLNTAMPTGEQAVPDLAAQIKFFNYPWAITQASAFGTPPDLFCRYALGVDYTGQPVYEVLYDRNAANNTLARPLLTDSPYELDLSRAQRRDTWAASFSNPAAAFSQSLVQDDDAAFSPTDLEKVLRAWDADSGSLPSRLWDVVDAFDPEKLMKFDPYRVASITTAEFGITNPQFTDPEYLATAQQIASINRRLVTTDSFDLPVAAGSVPNQGILALGPDGRPGRAGFDDDGDDPSNPDEPDELNATISDDFRPLFGKEVAQATIFDLLRYRVWQHVRALVMQQNGWNEATLAGQNTATYTTFLTQVSQLAESRINGETTDVNGNGAADPPLAQLLAPELMAGIRMDVNRPLGDGKDNGDGIDNDRDSAVDESGEDTNNDGIIDKLGENGDPFMNGVVDDPLEAGEPFLDVDGNGKWNGEPFIDLDGNGQYSSPVDQLWANLTASGTIGEPITFDYTNGQAEYVHKEAFGLVLGGVRNLESQARQLDARHLYCLMLLLVDENYVAPWDENDPQVMTYVEIERKKLTTAGVSAVQADFIAKRKLTCRMVAQWAVNCVDMRDSDVIMTPFEYDENPWDGWGCPDGTTVGGKFTPINTPLDGDSATDENKGEIIDWNTVATNGGKKVLKTVPSVPTPLNQTRGVVWGAERPELLITETLAFHDRRTEDLASNDSNGHGEMKHYNDPGESHYKDGDPDQGLRPRGSLFVEVKNPWSQLGQYPAELYTKLDSTTAYAPVSIPKQEGVDLSRLSNLAVDGAGNLSEAPTDAANGIKRSPVWRMIVVEEWPDFRNADPVDDNRTYVAFKAGTTEPPAYVKTAAKIKTWVPTAAESTSQFRPTDPDFDAAFDAAFVPKQQNSANMFEVQFPYVEREFYFTTDKSPPAILTSNDYDQLKDFDYSDAKFKLRIPYRAVPIRYATGAQPKPGQTQKFIPIELENASATQPAIAPVRPGRYAVIGSAGARYSTDPNFQRYTTTIGRLDPGSASNWNTDDIQHFPLKTRRIEMWPNNQPDMPQLLVAANGGDPKDEFHPQLTGSPAQYDPTTPPISRDNELINDQGTVKNIEDSRAADGTPTGTPNSRYYQPCVTIPVQDMNVSEPAWGYAAREYEAAQFEAQKIGGTPQVLKFKADTANKNFEGRYFKGSNRDSYDKPLDMANEVIRTGTTPNYRAIHLQRLANPLLPWNPSPGQFKDSVGVDLYRPNLPVNPYRTVDTSSVNLTAFNGVSAAEANYPDDPSKTNNLLQNRPWALGTDKDQGKYLNVQFPAGKQVWYFRSLERGFWSRLNVLGSVATPVTSPPQRSLWAQEPAMVKLKKSGFEIFDLMPQRQMTMRALEVPGGIKDSQNQDIQRNRVEMVMEHSLGFGNESYGLLYDLQGAKQPGTPGPPTRNPASTTTSSPPTVAAVGAPAPDEFEWDTDPNLPKEKSAEVKMTVNSTYPWLAWGNRPFVSAEELLDVPAASQAQMLRQYSAGSAANPYDGIGIDTTTNTPIPNLQRLAGFKSPFGHLMNLAATSLAPADVVRNPATGVPVPDAGGNVQAYGAPNFYRVLEFVQVPSRFVGTDTMLNAETFNDNQLVNDPIENIGGPADPRYFFQPPFNKVSRERDPGRVNLNTVTGRRAIDPATSIPRIWSEVFDGIMHRDRDLNQVGQAAHFGPAWRDIVLSRKGYAQANADVPIGPNGFGSVEKKADGAPPDVNTFGLNSNFPTFFSNPFRSPDAGDLVPLQQMVHYGVDVGWMRRHHYNRGGRNTWGSNNFDDDDPTPKRFRMVDDAREAGFGRDDLVVDAGTGALLPITSTTPFPVAQSGIPLFSETFNAPYFDGERNPYMYYEPMTRLGNLVTNRSGAFAIWITVGYFEVEKAPGWTDTGVPARFGGDINLYNRVYPDGYMLGKELGGDTGNVKRPRGFYIIDRTEEVGFKPGEDLNVEKLIRLRRRIE